MGVADNLFELFQTASWPRVAAALLAIFCAIFYAMLRYIRDQHRERIEEQRSTIKLVEGVRGFLSASEKALDRNTDRLDRLSEKLDQFIAEWRAG